MCSDLQENGPCLTRSYFTFMKMTETSFITFSVHLKATEWHSLVVLFITLYKVVLTFENVDEILHCDHSNESY